MNAAYDKLAKEIEFQVDYQRRNRKSDAKDMRTLVQRRGLEPRESDTKARP